MNKSLYYDKTECCGCEACVNICPQHIIKMQEDIEGFLYPMIEESNLCRNCGKCLDVCPVKNINSFSSNFIGAYYGWAKDDDTVKMSSSGGIAAVLSEYFVKMAGIVYGVAFSDDFTEVHYRRADTIDELDKFRGSKYVQAQKGDVFKAIQKDLKNDKEVLFIGTPCDTYAVRRFIGNHEKLYLVSIICHGPTSPKVHKIFCSELIKSYDSLFSSFSMRYKKNGEWKPYYINVGFTNGNHYMEPFEKTEYNTAFLYFKRPSCSSCKFKMGHFAADILIGDNHSAGEGQEGYNSKGASSILLLTEKGNRIMELISDSIISASSNLEQATQQKAVRASVVRRTNREQYAKELNCNGLKSANNIISIRIEKKKNQIFAAINRKKRIIKNCIKTILITRS